MRDRHWSIRKRKTDAQRTAVLYAAKASGYGTRRWPMWREVTVTITRIAPRRLDSDNSIAGCKAVRDQLAACLGMDDADARIEWKYEQERGRPKFYGIRVRIESRQR